MGKTGGNQEKPGFLTPRTSTCPKMRRRRFLPGATRAPPAAARSWQDQTHIPAHPIQGFLGCRDSRSRPGRAVGSTRLRRARGSEFCSGDPGGGGAASIIERQIDRVPSSITHPAPPISRPNALPGNPLERELGLGKRGGGGGGRILPGDPGIWGWPGASQGQGSRSRRGLGPSWAVPFLGSFQMREKGSRGSFQPWEKGSRGFYYLIN